MNEQELKRNINTQMKLIKYLEGERLSKIRSELDKHDEFIKLCKEVLKILQDRFRAMRIKGKSQTTMDL